MYQIGPLAGRWSHVHLSWSIRGKRKATNQKWENTAAITVGDLPKRTLRNLFLSLGVLPALHAQAEKVADTLPNLKISVVDVSATGLAVNVARLNAATQPEYRVWAPKFPKPQSEGFFVIVADITKDEVLALKRISWQSGTKAQSDSSKPISRSVFKLPPSEVDRMVDVLVVSDAYIGMSWKAGAIEVPGAPVVDDNGGKNG